MNEEYFEIISKDGLTLHGKKWIVEKPVATVCIVHGFGEHLERYNHVAEFLATINCNTYSYDLRGHGKSEGRRGHSRKYQYLMQDMEELLVTARADNTDIPIFLMGHSFGGNQVANYMLRDQSKEITGVILSSPWFKLAFEPPAMKVKLAGIMNNIFPGYREKSEMEISHISKDPKEVEAYANDPLIHSKLSARLFLNIREAGLWAIENAQKVKVPTLIYHGAADQIISHDASKEFAENAGSLVSFHSLENVYHEPHNDLERNDVFELIKDFIESRI